MTARDPTNSDKSRIRRERTARLEDQLRSNLRRRKDQARARNGADQSADSLDSSSWSGVVAPSDGIVAPDPTD